MTSVDSHYADVTAAGDSSPPAPASWRPLVPWLGVAAATITLLAAVAVWFAHERQIDTESARIEAVASLRAQQVASWVDERSAQFRFLGRSPLWPELLARWQDNHDESAQALLAERTREYTKGHGFAEVWVIDASGRVLPLAIDTPPSLAAPARDAMRRAQATGQPAMTEIYRQANAKPELRLDFVVPMSTALVPAPSTRWLVLVRIDPLDQLMPSLESWPDSRAAVQTQLVQRIGDTLVGPNASNPVPLSRRGLLAAMVVRGEAPPGKALFAEDFAGREVFGAVRPLAGTPWWLVSRVQRDDVLRPVWQTAGWVVLAALLAMALAVGAANMVRQRRALQGVVFERDRQAQRLRALSLVEGLANSSLDAIYAKDSAGRYVVFNPAAARLSGHAARDVIGRRDREVFDADAAAEFEGHEMRALGAGRAMHFEERLAGPQGVRALEVVRGPLTDEAGRVVGAFGIARDVTEPRRIEAEAEHHRRRVDELLQSRTASGLPESVAALIAHQAPGRMAYWDADMRCRYVNDMYCEWFGKRREDLIGRAVEEIFSADFDANAGRPASMAAVVNRPRSPGPAASR